MVAAPGLLVMTIGRSRFLDIVSAVARATESEPSPAAYPTTHSMGLASCAAAKRLVVTRAMPAIQGIRTPARTARAITAQQWTTSSGPTQAERI